MNYLYTPKQQLEYNCLRQDTLMYAGQTEYKIGKIYGTKSLAQINQEIDKVLLKKFGEGLPPADAEPADSVSIADVWYVARLLDGFVIDTNIPEIKKIVYGNDYDTHDGTGVRDYIHVVDLAKGHVAAVNYSLNNLGCEVFNLGTGTGYSVLDMVKAFNEANGLDLPYKIVDRRPGDLATCYADPAKSAEKLGWKAEKSLVDMCRDSWRWQSQNPMGYAKD